MPRAADNAPVCFYCLGVGFLESVERGPVCPLCSGLGFLELADGSTAPTQLKHDYRPGIITDYNEQGMEASYHLVFIPSDAPNDRGQMRILQAGDELRLWDDDGSVLWGGVLRPTRRLLRAEVGPQHPAWSAPSVTQETWLGWFRRRPCLRAWWRRAEATG